MKEDRVESVGYFHRAMRRSEFAVTDSNLVDAFLSGMSYGVLGFKGDEGVDLTPVNFAQERGEDQELRIYFHGTRSGHRRKSLAVRPEAVFSVVHEYVIVPSYFLDPGMACHATAFFKSVLVYGSVEDVEEPAEKGRILGLLMQKLQPEGGYNRFEQRDGSGKDEYAGELKRVGIYSLRARKVSAKFKFGQNMGEDTWRTIRERLLQRGNPKDLAAVREMEYWLQYSREKDDPVQ